MQGCHRTQKDFELQEFDLGRYAKIRLRLYITVLDKQNKSDSRVRSDLTDNYVTKLTVVTR